MFFGSLGVVRIDTNWAFSYVFSTDSQKDIEVNTLAFSYDDMFNVGEDHVSYNVMFGDVMIPIGLYELQRTQPDPYTPPTLNNSFINNQYSQYFNNNEYGLKFDVDYGSYTVTSAAYIPRDKKFGIQKTNPFYQDIVDSSLEQQNKDYSEQTSREIRNSIELGDRIRNNQLKVTGTSQFFALIYDNRRNLLVDTEFYTQQLNYEYSNEEYDFQAQTKRIGVERRTFERLFFLIEYLERDFVGEGKTLESVGRSQSLLYDKTPFLPYIGYNDYKSDVADVQEFNIGFSYNINDNLAVKLNYRKTKGEYVPFERIAADMRTNECNSTCRALARDNFVNKYDRFEDADDEGLEATITFTF